MSLQTAFNSSLLMEPDLETDNYYLPKHAYGQYYIQVLVIFQESFSEINIDSVPWINVFDVVSCLEHLLKVLRSLVYVKFDFILSCSRVIYS